MNDDAYERLFAEGLTGLAPTRAPADLGSTIKTTTSRKRPRPRWFALIKEPPMRLSSRVTVGSPTARVATLMAATLALVLVLAAAAVAASTFLSDDTPVDVGDWPMFKRDAARTGGTVAGPIGGPVLRWRYAADGAVTANVSIVGDLVYIASEQGVLRAVGREDGLERWRYTTEAPGITGPVGVDGAVYVVDGAGVMVAVDAETGVERWRSSVRLPGGGNPIPADGLLLIGIATGDLVAIDAESGAEAWRAQVSPTGGAVRAPAYADGRAFVASDGGGFIALDIATREILWRFDTGDAQTGTAGVIDGVAYIGGSPEGGSALLWALDATTGDELWRIDHPIFTPAVADGVGYSGSDSGLITAFDTATGAIRWQETLEGVARPLAVADGVVYVPAGAERRVYALDAQTGDELWRFDVDAGIDCCIAVAHGSVFVGTQAGSVYAIGGDGGEPPGPPPSVAPAASPSVALGGSETPTGSASPLAFLPDGTYVAEVSVAEMDAAEARFRGDPRESEACPCTHRFSIRDGTWHDGEGRPIAFSVVADRVDLYGSMSFRWSWDGRSVTFSDREGGTPGDSLVFEAKPFELQAETVADEPPAALEWSTAGGAEPMRYPSGVTIAPDGRIWVVDSGNSRIGIFEPDGTLVEYWGTEGSGPGEFVLHRANGDGNSNVAFAPDGSFYLIDAGGKEIQHWSAHREFIREWGGIGTDPGTFLAPAWIATDVAGNVYVIDGERNVVEIFDAEGDVLRTFEANEKPGTAWTIAVDREGDIWVGTCCPEATVRKFDPTGRLLMTLGIEVGSLAFDASGRIYSGQFPVPGAEDLVVVFDLEGDVLARFGGVPGSPDGMGFPWGLALDGAGDIYVSDYGAEVGTTGSLKKYRLQGALADVDALKDDSASSTTSRGS